MKFQLLYVFLDISGPSRSIKMDISSNTLRINQFRVKIKRVKIMLGILPAIHTVQSNWGIKMFALF
jgi:hypothetical protein